MISGLIWLIVWAAVLFVAFRRRGQRRHGGVGTAAVGAMYGFLNEEQQNAVELIVEHRAEARDPEDAEGHLPDLENPRTSQP